MAFDVITPTKLGRGALATTPTLTTVYTVPTLTRTIVKTIDICNTTTGRLTAYVYLVESGGTAGTSNALLYAMSVPPSGNIQWTGAQVMNAGDVIQASGSASGLTINVSGGECV